MSMSDIVERLRFRADENYEMLGNIHEPLLEAAAEIERLRAGGCARDQGTTQYCAEAAKLAAEIERLRKWNAEIALNAREFAAENERLRAALEDIAYPNPLHNEDDLMGIARAALEGRK